ncbi:MAG: TIGR00730 family Rossman fold protein [Anaerolineae bacterium]|nr:MAG: TIGR00730 family Rossman fold protein [Anaerolineae bacterium]
MKSICVFCGSSDSIPAHYYESARAMGTAIAGRGLKLVYGAGSTGLMGAVANGALAAGGEVVGVIPQFFHNPALAHSGLTQIEVTPDMHTRKARMYALSDAFVALPGGLGTMDEFFEAVTWAQIGLHRKPVGLLNVSGYFDGLLSFLDRVREEGFMYKEHGDLFRSHAEPEPLLTALADYRPPDGLERWVAR